MKKLLSALLALALTSSSAFAEIGCKVNGSHANCKSDQLSNLDFKAQTGSDILTQTGLTMAFPALSSNMFATGVANGGATSIASTTNTVPVGYAFVRMGIPATADPAFTTKTLPNGTPGQILTIYVTQVGPGSATLTGGTANIVPAKSTGFTNIKLTAVNDNVVLHYVDSTVGWVIQSWDPGASSSITITLSGS